MIYSYCILQYTDDPSRGEYLNCGVLVWLPTEGKAIITMNTDLIRLSRAFPRFSVSQHTKFGADLTLGVHAFNSEYNRSNYHNAQIVSKWLLPDQGMAYRFDGLGGGVSQKSIEEIASELSARLVEMPA